MKLNFFILLLITFQSCCIGTRNTSLGGGYKISEFSFRETEIMYCADNCCNTGIPVIPQTVVSYNFDENWIIAKTDSNYQQGRSEFAYWIYHKISSTSINDDSIKKNLIGPLDSISFYNSLQARNIILELENYLIH